MLVLLCAMLCLHASAQNTERIDSLEKILPASKDTARINILNALSKEHFRIDPKITEKYAKQALDASRKLKYDKGISESFSNIALFSLVTGDYDTSVSCLDSALAYAGKANDIALKAYVLNIKGVVYFNKGELKESLGYFEQSLALKKKIGNLEEIAKTQSNIGSIYLKLSYFDKALENYMEVLKVDEMRKDTLSIASNYNNIGLIYIDKKEYGKAVDYFRKCLAFSKSDKLLKANCLKNLSTAELKQKNYKEGLNTALSALELYEQLSNSKGIYSCYNSIGVCYQSLGEYDKALKYLNKALKSKSELGDDTEIVNTLTNIGAVYWKMGNNEKAITYLEESNRTAVASRELGVLKNNNELLMLIYAQLGNKEKRDHHYLLWQQYNDTIREIETSYSIGDIEAKYETEKKEREIAQLSHEKAVQELQVNEEKEKRRLQVGLLIMAMIVLAGGAWIWYSRNRLKQQKAQFRRVIEAEEQERKRIAMELHDGLGQLLSTARLNVSGLEDAVGEEDAPYVKTSMNLIDEACQEVRSISHNLMPGTLIKLGLVPALKQLISSVNKTGKLNVQLKHDDIEGKMSQSEEIAFYRVIQECLNNIIKYANAQNATISITKAGNRLSLLIEDDGVGMDVSTIDNSRGIGWKNIRSRVDMLNGKLEVRSDRGKGTAIDIKVICNN
jgi:signal transduction histidine kinase/Flp pilus assembly protein TadD